MTKEAIGLSSNMDVKSINEDTIIDMSKLDFPCEETKQVYAAMLFIRNLNLNANYNFDNCDYKAKEEFLLIYITKSGFETLIKDLTNTWIKILTYGILDVDIDSILSDEEIKQFHENNGALIFEMKRLLISIPLVSIKYFEKSINDGSVDVDNINMDEFNLDDVERTDYFGINIRTYVNILESDIMVVLQQSIDGIQPIWYNKYFNTNSRNAYHKFFLLRFPYLDILNLLVSDNGSFLDDFINQFNNLLESKINEYNKNDKDEENPI